MKKLIFTLAVTSCLCMTTNNANAAGVTVNDPVAIAKQILQYKTQLEQYARQYEQLQQAINQAKAMTGTRLMGNMLNTVLDQDLRRALPADLGSLLDPSSGSFSMSAEEVVSILEVMQERYDPVKIEDFGENADLPWHKAYSQHSKTTHSTLAASETAYNNTAKRVESYETFLSELNNSEDVKTTADLQARISVENGILTNEMLRMMSLQMQQQAAADNARMSSIRSLHQARQ